MILKLIITTAAVLTMGTAAVFGLSTPGADTTAVLADACVCCECGDACSCDDCDCCECGNDCACDSCACETSACATADATANGTANAAAACSCDECSCDDCDGNCGCGDCCDAGAPAACCGG